MAAMAGDGVFEDFFFGGIGKVARISVVLPKFARNVGFILE